MFCLVMEEELEASAIVTIVNAKYMLSSFSFMSTEHDIIVMVS